MPSPSRRRSSYDDGTRYEYGDGSTSSREAGTVDVVVREEEEGGGIRPYRSSIRRLGTVETTRARENDPTNTTNAMTIPTTPTTPTATDRTRRRPRNQSLPGRRSPPPRRRRRRKSTLVLTPSSVSSAVPSAVSYVSYVTVPSHSSSPSSER